MVVKLMHFLVLLFCSTSSGSGFLLEKETATGPGGNSLTDQHYIYLLGLLTQEKGNVQQMENFMLKLNNEVKLLQQVQRNGSSQEMVDLKNGYTALQNEFNQVKQEINQKKNENSALTKTNEMLRNEIHMCSNKTRHLETEISTVNNKTMKLQKELELFTHSIQARNVSNITQIQSSVENLEHKLDTTTTKLNMLAFQSNARSQDFLALLNQTRDAQHKLNMLDSENKFFQNNTNQKIMALETKTEETIQEYKNNTIQRISTMETDLNGYKGNTSYKIENLKTDVNALTKTNEMLRNEIHMCSNKTMKLQKELEIFTHSNISNITQIQSSVETLEHKEDTTTAKLNMLASQSNALSHDFFALLDQIRDTQHKLAILDSETKQRFQNYQQNSSQTIAALETQTKSSEKKINDVFRQLTAINQTVFLTSCGQESRSVTLNSVLKFGDTKTVYGINNVSAFISSGKFTCEVPGVYLFSVFITSTSSSTAYTIYKNNNIISYVFISYNVYGHVDNRHTGTGIVAVSLSVGDTLYVTADYDMHVFGVFSCMTVVKIR